MVHTGTPGEEDRFRELLESVPDAVVIVGREGRILFANTQAQALFGYSTGALRGQPLEILVPDRFRARHAGHFASYVSDPRRRQMGIGLELYGVRKDGSEFPVDISLSPLDTPEGPSVITTIRDLTERRRLEEQLRLWQRLEAVGRLAGGIAHDFNNLLTVITGRSLLLLSQLRPEDPAYREIEVIHRTSERATELTKQLLAFGRKQMLAPKVLDLNEVIGGLEPMLRRLISEDIELVTVQGPDLGKVKADRGQIEQVIVNLAANARDAMPGGGRLTIETANVDLDAAYATRHVSVSPGRYVMVAVSDSGHGMDAETLAHLFEPFFTTKGVGKGTGLGLATVYGIVKQSGGNVWVYSEPGQGTAVKLYLPQVEGAIDPPAVAPAAGDEPRGTETILLVEDEDPVRHLAREILERLGYTVLEAGNAGEALVMAERHSGVIHLLLTDVVMPRMSGRSLAAHLAPLRPEMGVLYVSGYAGNAIVRHGVLDPGIPFLQKPFTPTALARKVREVLDTFQARMRGEGPGFGSLRRHGTPAERLPFSQDIPRSILTQFPCVEISGIRARRSRSSGIRRHPPHLRGRCLLSFR